LSFIVTELPAIHSYRFALLRAGQPQGIAPTKNDTISIRSILDGVAAEISKYIFLKQIIN